MAQTVMIGDDVTDDVLGAINAGMKAILVRTGKYRKGGRGGLLTSVLMISEHKWASVGKSGTGFRIYFII